MILLFLFITYWIGLSWRYSWILFAIIGIGLIVFLFWRFGKKVGTISILVFLVGFGVSFIRPSSQRESFSGVVVEAKENYFIFSSNLERFYVYEKDNNYEIGDFLEIKGKKEELNFVTLESQFDFNQYLDKKGVYNSFSVEKININFSNPIRIKQLRTSFLSHFDEDTRGVVSSILFSQQLDSETVGVIKDLHLSRLISASGLYVYAFLAGLEFVLKLKIKEKWAKLISLGILSVYFVFTFPRFSILKILVISLLRWFNNHLFKKKFRYFEVLSISGFMFLIFDYHLAYQDGFILGYTIPITFHLCRNLFSSLKKWWRKLLTTLLMFTFFIPFELQYFHSVEPFAPINQILLTPYFILIAILSLFSFYGIPIYKVVEWVVYPLKWIMKPLSFINLEIYAPPMNEWFIFLYYLLFIVTTYYLSIRFKPIVKGCFAFAISFLTVYFLPIKNFITTSVSFINVGQGDACLIRKGQSAIMIDTGGLKYQDLAKETLIPYLKKEKIYSLDLVITTHDDYDHCGALDSLKENFTVKNYINNYKNFPLSVEGIQFKNYNFHIDDSKEENDKSLVIGFALSGVNYLIMGDAPTSIERKIMKENKNVPCDILKVGHHGSNTSSSNEFIRYLNPKEAIISVGKNNSFGHPHKEVITYLNLNKVKVKRTDELGTITYTNYIFM